MHNDACEQCGPSSVCPQRATVDCRSYNLSWIHHSPGIGPLPSETTGLVEQPGPACTHSVLRFRVLPVCICLCAFLTLGLIPNQLMRWWSCQSISLFSSFASKREVPGRLVPNVYVMWWESNNKQWLFPHSGKLKQTKVQTLDLMSLPACLSWSDSPLWSLYSKSQYNMWYH